MALTLIKQAGDGSLAPPPVAPCAGGGTIYAGLAKRFWPRVRKDEADGCWIWQGSRTAKGYGRFTYRGKGIRAHRAAWMLANGREFPSGLICCHRCDNPPCVNPSHLFLGDHLTNSRDCCAKGRARAPLGEQNGQSKLAESQVREALLSKEFHGTVARRLGVSMYCIYSIRRGLTWRHVFDAVRAGRRS